MESIIVFFILPSLIFSGNLAKTNKEQLMDQGGISLLLMTAADADDPQTLCMVAGAIANLCRNGISQDITLGVALGSATQISMFVIPLIVTNAWILGINMDLDFNLLETGSLALSILVTTFTLQDGTSHYLKGLVLLCCYVIIGACFFVLKAPLVPDTHILNSGAVAFSGGALAA